MIFGYFIFFTATLLSFVAAYYSVTGLATIFAAAAIPVIIMGSILELGKVVATVWLHSNWERVPRMFKLYLVPAVAFLMLLTSMGIFGFLSKAHLDQAVPTGDIAAQVEIYDEKIRTHKDNIDAARKALRQMDESVDQLMGRSTDERGADKAVQLRRTQARERQRLQTEIAQAQKEITKLQEQRAPVASELRKVEAEVGPIKYLAALVYGDTTDHAVLESAVRWVIILIVLVFDPLALVLILAGTKQISWARGQHKQEEPPPVYAAEISEPPIKEEPILLDTTEQDLKKNIIEPVDQIVQANNELAEIKKEPDTDTLLIDLQSQQETEQKHKEALNKVNEQLQKVTVDYEASKVQLAKLQKEFSELSDAANEVSRDYLSLTKEKDLLAVEKLEVEKEKAELKSKYEQLVAERDQLLAVRMTELTRSNSLLAQISALEELILKLQEEAKPKIEAEPIIETTVEEQPASEIVPQAEEVLPVVEETILDTTITQDSTESYITTDEFESSLQAEADTDDVPPNAAFGTKFPLYPKKGDLFLRVDYLPAKLFKWNDFKWIEIDKSITDSYTYDEAYIKYLIGKLAEGVYDIDDLSRSEQDQVTEYLRKTRRV